MKRNILLSLLILYRLVLMGQQANEQQEFMNVIPPSPNASELGKFIEHPIGYYTGIPNISIPLHTIKAKGIEIPISLSYNASGIRVEQIASWIGLGWSLNAGGIITRTVRGLPDDRYEPYQDVNNKGGKGYLYSGSIYDNLTSTNDQIKTIAAKDVSEGLFDSEPDMFYFSFLNYQGKFIFDNTGKARLVQQNDFVVSYVLEENGPITSFTITTTDGVKFVFATYEETSDNLPHSYPFYSSWYLTSIITQVETVSFIYADEQMLEKKTNSQVYYIDGSGTAQKIGKYTTTPIIRTKAKRLYEITWNGGKVRFNATTNRQDIGHHDDDIYYSKLLNNIQVYDNNSILKKRFNLSYSYFEGTGCSTNPDDGYLCKRLKLNSVTEVSGSLSKPPYSFEYNETALPPRNSYKQDYWGFYKNNSGTTFIPDLWAYPGNSNTYPFSVFQLNSYSGDEYRIDVGIDRSPNEANMKAGILIKINNPYGGYSAFAYEPHRFIYANEERTGGGLRINNIRYNENGYENEIVKNYSYVFDDNPSLSSGKIFYLPQFAYIRYEPGKSITNLSSLLDLTKISTHNMGGLGESQGSYVGYSEVIETVTGNGKKVMKFKTPATFEDETEECSSGTCIYERAGSECTNGLYLCWPNYPFGSFTPYLTPNLANYDNFPYAPNPNFDWNRGLLTDELIYAENDLLNPIKEITYTYNIKNYVKIPAIKCQHYTVIRSIPPSGCCAQYPNPNDCPNTADYSYYKLGVYYNLSSWNVLTSKTEKVYDDLDNTKFIETEENYGYLGSNHHQLTSKTIINSNGEELKTKFQYPKDYYTPWTAAFNTEALAIDRMKSRNMITTPIEIINYKNSKVIDATLKAYKWDSDREMVLPYYTANLKITEPLAEGDGTNLFTPSEIKKIGFANWDFLKDNHYTTDVVYNKFDDFGNLLQYHKTNDNNQSFIWGYGRQYPIAKVENAVSNETFFTSFEGEEEDLMSLVIDDCVTTRAYSGDRSLEYTLSNPSQSIWERRYEVFKLKPVISGLPKRYKYSGWVYSSGPKAVVSLYFKKANGVYNSVGNANTTVTNQWTYVEGEYTLPATFDGSTVTDLTLWVYGSDNSGKIWFDDLRLYPADAQMTSYTYDPLVGMTSQTGPDNKTTTYKYDDFGRLEFVKDHNGNVLNKYTYHYKEGETTGGSTGGSSTVLNVGVSNILFKNGIYSTTINITSNVNWTILSSAWLTLSSNSGSNNQTITVSGNEALGDQTGTITISGGGITRTINVTQIRGPGDPLQIE